MARQASPSTNTASTVSVLSPAHANGADSLLENRQRNSSPPANKPSLFSLLHKELVERRNLERRGGTNVGVTNILLIREFNDYELVDDCDPLKWWRAKRREGIMVPCLNVVKKMFCIPATSVPSEQLFSKAGLLISEKRTRLSPKNVDMLLFLSKNA